MTPLPYPPHLGTIRRASGCGGGDESGGVNHSRRVKTADDDADEANNDEYDGTVGADNRDESDEIAESDEVALVARVGSLRAMDRRLLPHTVHSLGQGHSSSLQFLGAEPTVPTTTNTTTTTTNVLVATGKPRVGSVGGTVGRFGGSGTGDGGAPEMIRKELLAMNQRTARVGGGGGEASECAAAVASALALATGPSFSHTQVFKPSFNYTKYMTRFF